MAIFRRLIIAVCVLAAASVAGAATLPPGFSELRLTNQLTNPTAMAIAPDGRIFVCQQGGALRVIKNGALLPNPFVTLSVDDDGERGLLGIAFDPAFASNGFVYLYYTTSTSPIHNRVSRFTANGDSVVPGSELPILDLEALTGATNHNGGAIHFGLDGKLYVAVGENATAANAQALSNRLGKMLRINANGTIPADNPFVGTAGANPAIWALGLRNPFTFAFNAAGAMAINDVGQGSFEEVNDGIRGANYGWPIVEGDVNDDRFVRPRHAYATHSGGTCAITGGAFYTPPVAQFPADYVGDYFFADLCGGWIHRLDRTNNSVSDFAAGISNPVDIQVGADGSLYYLARGNGSLFRVQYNNPNPGPVAPVLTSFVNGLTVALSWTASAGATSYQLEAGSGRGATDLVNVNLGAATFLQVIVPADTYYVRVKALAGASPSPASNEVQVDPTGSAVCATPPPVPANYVANVAGLNALLTWQRAPSATSYVLEAGSTPGGFDLLRTDIGPDTSLGAVAPAGTYYTRVRARNACGFSGPSNEQTVALRCTAAPPANLRASKRGSIVTFEWTAAPDVPGGYHIQVGSSSGLANVLAGDVGFGTSVSVDAAGAPAATYYVRVLANASCGRTNPSNEVIVTLP